MFVSDPQSPGPLAELELWRGRADALSGLCEQLKLPMTKTILKLMSQANLVPLPHLLETITKLNNFHKEAKENVCFLSTVERYFKVSQNVMQECCSRVFKSWRTSAKRLK